MGSVPMTGSVVFVDTHELEAFVVPAPMQTYVPTISVVSSESVARVSTHATTPLPAFVTV